MRRQTYILLLVVTAVLWVVGRGGFSVSRTVDNTSAGVWQGMADDNRAADNALFEIAKSDPALPVQIEKIQFSCIRLTLRQQLKRSSETVYGRVANICTTHNLVRQIYRSYYIHPNLESFDIGFPFSSFW